MARMKVMPGTLKTLGVETEKWGRGEAKGGKRERGGALERRALSFFVFCE